MTNFDSVLKVIQGWVKLRGDSDGTKIGNVLDALKVVISPGVPVSAPPITHAEGAQAKDNEDIAGFIVLENDKDYANITCQIINSRDSLWRLAWVDNVGGSETVTDMGFGYTGSGNPTDEILPSIQKFTTGSTGVQHLRIYMTPLDKENEAYCNLSANKIS